MKRPVQTNEVGRSRALALGFLAVAAETGLPLRLLELGSSAGLNLRWDGFYYSAGGFAFGDAGSPVQFLDYAEGTLPSLPGHVRIVERAGCDEAPVALDSDGRLTLRSYLWPDQLERLRVLDGALEVAPRFRSPWSARGPRSGSSAGWPSRRRAHAPWSSTRS